MEQHLVWMVMAKARGVGRRRLAELMATYPDPYDAWQASVTELQSISGWTAAAAQSLVAVRRSREALRDAGEMLKQTRQRGLRLVAIPDLAYPVRLRQIIDPPPLLWVAGPWEPDARPVIAIVGSRKPTSYGLAMAERFARDLVRAGAVVVSGMARGIDLAAHRGALAEGGTTLAVLGGGADVCYPPEAMLTYRQIRATGAVISEQPPGAEPHRQNFPERNRIISGLADGVVVVEAGERSGTLITVGTALNQGRDVFAVPGPVTSPLSVGPHRLIREGACLVTSGEEVLEEMGLLQPGEASGRTNLGLSADEEQLFGWMGAEPRWAGDLAESCGLPVGDVQGLLTLLEVKGAVERLPNGQYLRLG